MGVGYTPFNEACAPTRRSFRANELLWVCELRARNEPWEGRREGGEEGVGSVRPDRDRG